MNKLKLFILKYKISLFVTFLFSIIVFLFYMNFRLTSVTNAVTTSKIIDPYLLVIKWNAMVYRKEVPKTIKEKEKFNLTIWDKIRTFSEASATIFWPDWSITRLWPKTAITINEMRVENDLSSLKIHFNLENWKTWSNVIKFFWDDSYFKETYEFGNYAATVRGTAFEINLDNDYWYAGTHDIQIKNTKTWEEQIIKQWFAHKLHKIQEEFSFEKIDAKWIEENINLDTKYFEELSKEWNQKIESFRKNNTFWIKATGYIKGLLWDERYVAINELINWKNPEENIDKIAQKQKNKDSLYKEIYWYYQNIHFIPNEENSPTNKSSSRKLLVELSKDDKKKKDLENTFSNLNIYDYVDSVVENWGKAWESIKKYIDPKIIEKVSSISESIIKNWKDIWNTIMDWVNKATNYFEEKTGVNISDKNFIKENKKIEKRLRKLEIIRQLNKWTKIENSIKNNQIKKDIPLGTEVDRSTNNIKKGGDTRNIISPEIKEANSGEIINQSGDTNIIKPSERNINLLNQTIDSQNNSEIQENKTWEMIENTWTLVVPDTIKIPILTR